MSAKSLQNTIYRAYGKVSGLLGFNHVVYRPIDYSIPAVDYANWVADIKASVSIDEAYSSTMKFTVPIWTLWADGTKLKVGDILEDSEHDRTFFIISMQPHLPINCIEATDAVKISRAAYTKADGIKTKSEEVIMNGLVANIQPASSAPFDNGNPAPSSADAKWDVYCFAPRGSIQIDDIVTDKDGRRASVTAANWYPTGYKLACTEV